MRMNRIVALGVLISMFSMCGNSQQPETSQTEKEDQAVDWSKLNPQLIDIAFDEIDATDRLGDALDRNDDVYSPREVEASKLSQKLRREASSDADQRLRGTVGLFLFSVETCRMAYFEDHCGPLKLSSLRDAAEADVKRYRTFYLNATKTKGSQ